MESREQILKEKRLTTRLQLATTRFKDVERERIWALATAHSEGLSIRTIAKVTGLSSSRVHQLLHTDEAHQIPDSIDPRTAYVSVEREWVLRVLKRVAANLDRLSGIPFCHLNHKLS